MNPQSWQWWGSWWCGRWWWSWRSLKLQSRLSRPPLFPLTDNLRFTRRHFSPRSRGPRTPGSAQTQQNNKNDHQNGRNRDRKHISHQKLLDGTPVNRSSLRTGSLASLTRQKIQIHNAPVSGPKRTKIQSVVRVNQLSSQPLSFHECLCAEL